MYLFARVFSSATAAAATAVVTGTRISHSGAWASKCSQTQRTEIKYANATNSLSVRFFARWFSRCSCSADHSAVSRKLVYGGRRAHQSHSILENETNSGNQHQRCEAKIYHLKWSHTQTNRCHACVCAYAPLIRFVFNAYEIRIRCAPPCKSLMPPNSRPTLSNGRSVRWEVMVAIGPARPGIGNLIYPPRHVSMCIHASDARLHRNMHFVQFFVHSVHAHTRIKYAKWKSPEQKTILQRIKNYISHSTLHALGRSTIRERGAVYGHVPVHLSICLLPAARCLRI